MEDDKDKEPEIVLQRVLYCTPKRKMTISRHQHFSFELLYLVSGSYKYQHNELSLELKGGEGALIRPGDWHTDFLSRNTVYMAVNFVLRPDAVLQGDTDVRLLRYKDNDKLISGILTKLLSENSNMDAFSSHLRESYALELFWQIMRKLPREVIGGELFENEESCNFREELQSLSLANIHNFLTLDEIASRLHITPRTLNNRCRAYLLMSPVKAFLKVKLDYSMKLVNQTTMSIKEISEYLGFKNPYHFSIAFKRFFRYSPESFRKK